jgi:hypothetical protein
MMMLRRLFVAVAGLTLVAVVNAPASLAMPHDLTGCGTQLGGNPANQWTEPMP